MRSSRFSHLTTSAIFILLCGSSFRVWPQGQIIFDNRINNVVVAPVYNVDPSAPGLSGHGNTASGFPAGTNQYSGPLVAGSKFTAQLFGGPPWAAARNLQPLFPVTTFRSDANAGFVLTLASTVTVPGVAGGEAAKMQLRVWDNGGGAVTNWAQAEANPAIARGESWPFITPPLGGPFHAPPNLQGLESFSLATGAFSGFSLKINFQTNGVPAPPGYLADTGLMFATNAGGLAFGWNAGISTHGRNRDAANSPDERHDTFILMDMGTRWQIALSNGWYALHIAAGDPTSTNGLFEIAAEGVEILSGSPDAGAPWVEADVLVEIGDGALSLQTGPGNTNTPLSFLEIARINPPVLQGPSASLELQTNFPIRFEAEVGFNYEVQGSSNFANWLPLGNAGHVLGETFQFDDAGSTNRIWRFYRTQTLLP